MVRGFGSRPTSCPVAHLRDCGVRCLTRESASTTTGHEVERLKGLEPSTFSLGSLAGGGYLGFSMGSPTVRLAGDEAYTLCTWPYPQSALPSTALTSL